MERISMEREHGGPVTGDQIRALLAEHDARSEARHAQTDAKIALLAADLRDHDRWRQRITGALAIVGALVGALFTRAADALFGRS